MKANLQIGGIYKTEFDERLFRIIGLDSYEVFYDCLWSENKWTFSGNFKSKSIFYRMSSQMFNSKSELIEQRQLTQEEFKYFRPDLPMRFGRVKQINWSGIDSVGLNFIESTFSKSILQTNKIIIVPSGPKGGYQKGVLIGCEENLTELNIIKKAIAIQKLLNDNKSNGIGFYRLGCEKGLPRYSIGEYFDRAGIMTL